MASEDQTVTRRQAKRPKPTPAQLGVDLAKLDWQRSGTGAGSLEVAFVDDEAAGTGAATGGAGRAGRAEVSAEVSWVLLRVAGDPAGRVLVYDRTEWLCFLDGVVRGEFG